MIGVYFSGTGNTKFCVDKFLKEYDHSENSFSIEESETLRRIENQGGICQGYFHRKTDEFAQVTGHMKEGLVLLDNTWKILNINPAAQRAGISI